MPPPDDITVSPIGGAFITEVLDDATTPIGVYVQVRGVAATVATASCVLKSGSLSVTLAPSVATAGEATSSISPANIDTLAGGVWSTFSAYWSGTVTDGSTTHAPWRLEQPIAVSNRVLRFPVDFARLVRKLLAAGRAAAIPSGQTNFWPQVGIALEDLRDKINGSSDVRTYLLKNEGRLRPIAEAWALEAMAEAMISQVNGQTAYLQRYADKRAEEKIRLWSELVVDQQADAQAWATQSGTRKSTLRSVRLLSGLGFSRNGGPLG